MDHAVRDILRASYDAQVESREAMTTSDWKVNERLDFLTLARKEKMDTLLELGAGPGKDSVFFQANGFDVTCTDLSPEMVKLCHQKGLKASVMDLVDLQFPSKSFDAVYAVNCLLHIPKEELPKAMEGISKVLKTNGLFYLGLYGGYDFEGIWTADTYEPKRFFSFYEDEVLQAEAAKYFDIESFKRVSAADDDDDKLHFQSMVLRKREKDKLCV
jgi:SAM-dependent methyltransferase